MSSSVAEDSASQLQESSVFSTEAPLQLTMSASSTPARGFLGFTPKGNPEVSQSGNQITYVESREGLIPNPSLSSYQTQGNTSAIKSDPPNTLIQAQSSREVQVVDSAERQSALLTQTNQQGPENGLAPSIPAASLPIAGAPSAFAIVHNLGHYRAGRRVL